MQSATMSQPPPQYAYSPPPAELPYYNALFAAADKSSSGYLSGQTAVEFFFLSKLPIDLLKQIWTMADQPPSNTLDPKKFYVAVRLIQLFQNGKKPIDLTLNVSEAERAGMRAPFFEGVDVQATMAQQQQPQQQQQLQPQQQQPSTPMRTYQQPPPVMPHQQPPPMMPMPSSGSTTILTVQDPYTMTPQELSRYESLFPSYAQPDPEGGGSFVHGAVAVELFGKSGMDRESLKAIWAMVDDPIDNKLDSIEFAIAMHLIVCVTKKGLPQPPSLPSSLASIVRYTRGQQPVQQTVQQTVPQPVQQQHQQQPPLGGMVGGGQPQPIPSPLSSPRAGTGMNMQQQLHMNGGLGATGSGGLGGGGMPSPIPSPTITPRIGTSTTNGGTMNIPQMPLYQQTGMQQQLQPSHPAQQQYMQPQVQVQQPWIQQQSQMGGRAGMPQMGFQHVGFGGGSVGGSTIDEAFAGLTNDPVGDLDGYSAAGSDASPAAPPAMQYQQTSLFDPSSQHQKQQQKHHAQLPPKSPKGNAKSPRVAASARARGRARSSSPSLSVESSDDLHSLREAHQKLLAEIISLRAKAASVSDEEYEVQKEIKSTAKEIGKLSIELSALKESVMEAKVKLGESVGILKVQVGKKESLEAQLAEAKATHESLAAAAAVVEEANELAMKYAARAVAAAAAATEDGSSEPVAAPAPGIVETADFFSWDDPPAPAPAPLDGIDKSSSEPSRGMWGSSESVATPDRGDGHYRGDSASVITMGTNASYMKYGVLGGEMGAPIDEGMGGGPTTHHDNFIPEPTGPIYPEYSAPSPNAGQYQIESTASSPTKAFIPEPMKPIYPEYQPTEPIASSPTKAELDALKSKTLKAEQSFRSYSDLVRSISHDVEKLESAARKAEAEASAIAGSKSKSKMSFGKSKAKKEYESALQTAQLEREKVEEAKAKLALAERNAEDAKMEMEQLRQKYEEMEMEAATVQSYLSVQKEAYNGHQQAAKQQSAAGCYQPQNQYNDAFSNSVGTHGYGMINSMDGDYDNPFAM
ncbi:hypothetical protein ACHAXA_000632 [Cyclostephanos tholiformis]|uniref:EH domain-containing protein n=1 Tax=Cyclostephanos tholiformis TaxID=382380 RepID=A0ABD3SQC1_9STRA